MRIVWVQKQALLMYVTFLGYKKISIYVGQHCSHNQFESVVKSAWRNISPSHEVADPINSY